MDNEFIIPKPEKYDFAVPSIKNSLSASTEILNRAPENIAYIEEAVEERNEALNRRIAHITLTNPEAKRDMLKAIIQEDKEAATLRKSLSSAQVMLDLWKNAQKSAAKFFSSNY